MEVEVFSPEFWKAFAPEAILIIGLLLIFIIPNLGNSKFRIPLTKTYVPWFLGGRRFTATGSPALPGMLATATLFTALGMMAIESVNGGMETTTVTSGDLVILQLDNFSRFFEIIVMWPITPLIYLIENLIVFLIIKFFLNYIISLLKILQIK